MSDYTQITDFSAKDALTTGDPEKIILGADFDGEFSAIATAIGTKYDSNDLASQAAAEAGSSNTVLMTPLRVQNWGDANGGMVGDIQALTDPNADTILGWDDSASAAINYTIGAGLTTSTTTISVSLLGIESLTDPGADRILFWDDSDSAVEWLQLSGLTITTNTLAVDAATTSASGIVELATDAEAQAGSATDKVLTPANLASVTATDARAGVIELATQAEVDAGTDTDRAVTPATLASAVGVGGIATGTFTPTWTGFSAAPSGDMTYVVIPISATLDLVYLYNATGSAMTGTSNATTMTISNLPTAIRPNVAAYTNAGPATNSGANRAAVGFINGASTPAVISFGINESPVDPELWDFSAWANSGTKGLPAGWQCSYLRPHT